MLTRARKRLASGDAQRRGTVLLLDHAGDAAKLSRLSEVASGVASERTPETLGRALAALKEELGMEVAFVSEFDRRRMVFRRLVGDGGSFGWREGGSIPLDDTYCRLLTEGRLPPVIPDAGADGRVKGLDVTGEARIGSYVGVPIRFSDGTLYGTLCCVSHSPDPSLQERDARFVAVLARLVADQIEHERSRRREAEARVRAHERRIISRELHDRVAHAMGVVHQSLQLHEALRDRDPEKAAEKLGLAKRMTLEAMGQTRDLSRSLGGGEAGEDLRAALSEMLSALVPAGVAHELGVAGDEGTIPDETREQLFLVLREAVRNAVSHSGASKVSVSVVVEGRRVVGAVEDDGRGFERKAAGPEESGGLAHMAERASLLGGTCSVDSALGEGTRVEVRLPVGGAGSPRAAPRDSSGRTS
jgi:signal transduction histidine kinase